ncbi:SulP family inorganic anion transporter [Alkalilimnicola ehrlichii MLHE-1]|uniref:Sulfate transporter n=1 Tax=Alkalilimnicola ehrlichii (strain ATCC BAA-1101 / DSM 17681 / MLHE-1) TaxID=187272 RepID=Q0A823_ALKEH|nr:SulP family inorganic anion transporter [Alkalilimnicola ehrlichii]ABI57014.1 sulfate transporter [Alkalilimnicola ehrlichii MLHE-1]
MLKRLLPFLAWPRPTADTLKADLLAGVTVALVLVPQSMAYATLAGMPPYYGLYAAFLPVIVAALWGSSPQLATGPVAVVALLTAAALAPLAEAGSGEFITLAIALAFMVGVIQLLLGAFRLGTLVNFISHPVIIGFTNAAAIVIVLSQLGSLLGLSMDRSGSFLLGVLDLLQRVPQAHGPTVLMGLAAIAMMVGCKRWLPRIPGVLLAVAVLTPVSLWLDFEGMGGAVVGGIPEGLPTLGIPELGVTTVTTLMTTALVIALVAFMEAISIAKAIATRTRDRIDPNQELIGQGLGNLVGSFSSAFPVSGSFSRSAVNYNAGARTGLSSVITGLLVALTLLFLTPLLYHLPLAVLAAIIMMAVLGLVNVKAVRHAWQAKRDDGIAAVVTFSATLIFAPHLDYGILLGAGLAIVLYLLRTMKPRVVLLARHPDGTLRDAEYFDLPRSPYIAAVRFDGDLYFANVGYFEDAILDARARHPEARFVLVVANGINQIDASGEETLHKLAENLHASGSTLVLAGLKLPLQELLERTGLKEVIGDENIYRNERHALAAIYQRMDVPGFDPARCPLNPEPAGEAGIADSAAER